MYEYKFESLGKMITRALRKFHAENCGCKKYFHYEEKRALRKKSTKIEFASSNCKQFYVDFSHLPIMHAREDEGEIVEGV